MNKLYLAPDAGKMYALYIDRVVYKNYSKKELGNDSSFSDNLLELHLFDDNKEYRFIHARNEDVETVIDDSVEHDDTYTEQIYVQAGCDADPADSTEKVEIVNYIRYDDDDLLTINNYRLKAVK